MSKPTVKRIYRDDKVFIQVEHNGVKLSDYVFGRDNAEHVQARLISLCEMLAPTSKAN
jgi:hypothetical protein